MVLFGADVVIFLYCIFNIVQFKENVTALVMFIMVIDFVAIIIATFFGIISPAFIITLFILLLIIGGIMLASYFNRKTTG